MYKTKILSFIYIHAESNTRCSRWNIICVTYNFQQKGLPSSAYLRLFGCYRLIFTPLDCQHAMRIIQFIACIVEYCRLKDATLADTSSYFKRIRIPNPVVSYCHMSYICIREAKIFQETSSSAINCHFMSSHLP